MADAGPAPLAAEEWHCRYLPPQLAWSNLFQNEVLQSMRTASIAAVLLGRKQLKACSTEVCPRWAEQDVGWLLCSRSRNSRFAKTEGGGRDRLACVIKPRRVPSKHSS